MKYIPYGRQSIDKRDIEATCKILMSDWLTQGPIVEKFETELASFCGVKYAVLVSSGTAALHIAAIAAGIKTGDEVIVPPLTFVATANAVLYAGGTPKFVDIKALSGNIDPNEIDKLITKKTKAIFPVHYAGFPCDMEKIHKIAKRNKLMVIEDACHALGSEYKFKGSWIKAGSCKHSDMAILSFHPVKHITTGEGGAVLTNDKKLYLKLKALRTHGIYKDEKMNKKHGPWYYEMRDCGFNYRITDFQCALGLTQLKKIKQFVRRRREIAGFYYKAFKNNPYFDVIEEGKHEKSSYHLFPILLKGKYKKKRKSVFNKLRESGLGVQVHYIPVYHQPFYRKLGYKKGICAKCEDFYSSEISIPMFPGMTNNDVSLVIKKIFKALKEV